MKNIKQTSYSSRLLEANRTFYGVFFTWLILLCIFSIGETVLNGIVHEYPKSSLNIILWAFVLNIHFWLKHLIIGYVFYILLYFINPKTAKVITISYIAILAIIHVALLMYFNTALVPLGADIYGYSVSDIKRTVDASGGIGYLAIIGLLLSFIIIYFLLNLGHRHIKIPLKIIFATIVLSFIILISSTPDFVNNKTFGNDYENNLVINKSQYFYTDSYNHFYPEEVEMDIYADSYIGDYEGEDVETLFFDYIDETNYPFLHKNNTPDVLSKFIKKSDTKPNIVILLIEGLGRAFTNKGAYLGNFTPFLDSLSNHSLYWKNCLSQGGRTFAVLPSLLGSLPFGENGFLAMGNNMPNHLSLYNLLKKNGYHTSFYCGTDASFDNMDIFLKKNKIDEIKDHKTFPLNATILPPKSNGFSWGYSDKALYKHYLTTTTKIKKPKLSVLLTLATHSPFRVEEQERYDNKFENRIRELGFTEETQQNYKNYKAQYASILYADDAIKEFINNYKKRDDYENTIFIITGDHRMPEIPMATKIDRYHVPLIVYSPLLKSSATFASVSTHIDIAPSLLAHLDTNYDIKTPSLVSWIGDGLDTVRGFQNIHSYPLMQTKTNLVDYILGEYHLNKDDLFELKPNMGEDIYDNDEIKNRLKNFFDTFKRKNKSIMEGQKIIPDSIFQNYTY